MNANHTMLTSEPIINSDIKNKGFLFLDEMFKKHGWNMRKNELNWISYTKFGDETSYFDIKIDNYKITVSVPLKNSLYQYVTTFKSYYAASEYIEQRFFDYIK